MWDPQVFDIQDSHIGWCAANLNPCTTVLFGVSSEFMVLMTTG